MFHFEKIEFSRTILSFSKSFANVMTKIVIFSNFIFKSVCQPDLIDEMQGFPGNHRERFLHYCSVFRVF